MPASRRPQTHAPPGQPARGAVAATHVAAFGDSLMWGQGLDRKDRFTQLITNLLPAILGGQPAVVAADAWRSGAQICGVGDDRQNFVDTFPGLFASAREKTAFLDGKGDRPATALYGENPAPFPTVRGQVALLSTAEGKAIDVALVDGGINDIAVEKIVDPTESPGEFVERWDGDIRRVGHDYVLELLLRVRRKCPKAVILYFGFFAPLSYLSSTTKLRDLFEYEIDDAIGWFVNGVSAARTSTQRSWPLRPGPHGCRADGSTGRVKPWSTSTKTTPCGVQVSCSSPPGSAPTTPASRRSPSSSTPIGTRRLTQRSLSAGAISRGSSTSTRCRRCTTGGLPLCRRGASERRSAQARGRPRRAVAAEGGDARVGVRPTQPRKTRGVVGRASRGHPADASRPDRLCGASPRTRCPLVRRQRDPPTAPPPSDRAAG
jgi:hypothetical protein